MKVQSIEFKIEIEDRPKRILIVFDRKMDCAMVPWQDAMRFADVMEDVMEDVVDEFMLCYPVIPAYITENEQAQIKFNYRLGLVAFVPSQWTDRIAFTSLEAFNIVRLALRQTAQDAHLFHDKGVRLIYTDKRKKHIKEVQDNSGHVQKVR